MNLVVQGEKLLAREIFRFAYGNVVLDCQGESAFLNRDFHGGRFTFLCRAGSA